MNTKAETGGPSALDTAKLAAAVLVVLGGFVAYYWFADASVLLRVLGLVVALVVGVVIAFQSSQGQQLWLFIQGSQVEIRKVIWPTQQETVNTTLVVIAFTVIMAAFFFVVDFLLLNITQFFTGQGG